MRSLTSFSFGPLYALHDRGSIIDNHVAGLVGMADVAFPGNGKRLLPIVTCPTVLPGGNGLHGDFGGTKFFLRENILVMAIFAFDPTVEVLVAMEQRHIVRRRPLVQEILHGCGKNTHRCR